MTLPLALFISDIDGTLVTPDKSLTPASIRAVARLDEAGVGFSLISSRPPRGMAALAGRLNLKLPFAAFNGASIVGPDLTLIEAKRLSPEAARRALALLSARGVDAWVFADDAWLLTNPAGPNLDRERRTVGFEPTCVADFEAVIGRIDKIVGVSDDHAKLASVETEARAALGPTANTVRSQLYYLDFTSPEADKGRGVRALCAAAGVDPARTAVIGDMANDVAMFRVAGYSVAMGQAPDDVKAEAAAVTGPNTQDGFARAVETLILPRAEG